MRCPRSNIACEYDPCNACRCLNGRCVSWADVFIEAQKTRNINLCQEIKNTDYKNQCFDVLGDLIKSEEVTITTDKTEYEQGEDITYRINNKLNKPIFLPGCNRFIIQKKEKNGWEDHFYKLCEMGYWPPLEISSGQIEVFTGVMSTYNEVGLFRVQLYYGVACEEYVSQESCESTKTIYSNEFTIKEGPGNNPIIRCGGGFCKCMKEKECEPYGGVYIIPTGEGECSANLDNKMCCCPGV